MRIWLINPYGPLPGEAWRDYRFTLLAKTLAARGHDVLWWTANFSHQQKRFRAESRKRLEAGERFAIELVPTPSYSRNISMQRLWFERVFARHVEQVARDAAPPDLIIAADPPQMPAAAARRLARRFRVPLVIDVLDLWPELFASLAPRGLRSLVRLASLPLARMRRHNAQAASLVVVVAESYGRTLTAAGAKRVITIPIGIELPRQIRREANRSGIRRLVYAGSLGEHYDLASVIDAVALLQRRGVGAELAIAGQGPADARIRAAIARSGAKNVRLLGVVPPDQLAALYASTDIALAPYSAGSTVIFPVKFFDYLAAGLPVITSLDGEGADLLVAKGAGVRYAAGNSASLANAIELIDEHRREQMSDASRALARAFDASVLYDRFAREIEALMTLDVRPMRAEDLDRVVAIHRDAFPRSFLSFLGPRFLRIFYRATLRDGIAFTAVQDGEIAGFVTGAIDSRAFYRRLRRSAPSIALTILPVLLRRPATIFGVLSRANERTSSDGDQPNGVELMSLAVDPRRQRRGVGRALVEKFVQHVKGDPIWLRTAASGNDAVLSFYDRLGFKRARMITTRENRAMVELERTVERVIPFARPDIGGEEIDAVRRVLQSGWLTTGERTHEFERRFAEAVGARHAIALNSGTAALHLALEALGLKAGDEVIVPAYTFTATAEVVTYFGAKPVLADVDARTLNIDPADVARRVTDRTKAIIPVHFGGLAADLDAIRAVAAPRQIAIVEDAAHAFQARSRGRMIGSISEFTCFSFYATKTITTGEGGMLTTNDDARAERCRVMSLHGISHDAWNRYRAEGSWFYEVIAPGFKYNMTDIAAAIGLVQLAKAERMRSRRQEIALRYNEAFATNERFTLPAFDDPRDHAWHLYPLRLSGLERDDFIVALKQRRVGTSVHFIPLHLHPFYRDRFGFRPEDFPVSTREYQREVSLPIYSLMSDDEVNDVIDAVRAAAR